MNDTDQSQTFYVSSRTIGAAVVTAINEGTVLWAPELTAPEGEWRAAMADVDAEGRIAADHNSFHIRLDDASILIDAGLDDPGSAWSEGWLKEWPGARRTPGLPAGLESIGVQPEDITHVIITHTHFDHVLGLAVEGNGRLEPRFPHARVLIGRGDLPAETGDAESDIAARLRTIKQSGLLEPVDGDREVAPGLWMLHAPGESPGHSVVRLVSGDAAFYALGDLFHHACEVEHVEWAVPWAEQKTMRASRERFLHEAADRGALATFAHEPFPPWGRIVRADGGYRWQREQ